MTCNSKVLQGKLKTENSFPQLFQSPLYQDTELRLCLFIVDVYLPSLWSLETT